MMTYESKITVGNNSALGFDSVRITTTCVGFVHIFVPADGGRSEIEIELKRSELIDFLLRTQPNLELGLRVSAFKDDPK